CQRYRWNKYVSSNPFPMIAQLRIQFHMGLNHIVERETVDHRLTSRLPQMMATIRTLENKSYARRQISCIIQTGQITVFPMFDNFFLTAVVEADYRSSTSKTFKHDIR